MDWMRDEGRLQAFMAVADTGSFSGAARALGQTQPGVSTLVAALESSLGTPLFVRSRAGAQLTEAGEALQPHAAHILGTAEEARRAVDAATGARRRRLRVGGGEVLMTYVLPPALAKLRDRLPGLEARFSIVGEESAVLTALRDRRIDLALLTDRAAAAGLIVEPFATDSLTCLVPADHPLASADPPVSLPVLNDETLVVRSRGAVDRREVDRLLERAGVKPRNLLVASTFEAVRHCVRAGLGVALVPAAAASGRATVAVALEDPPTFRYCLVRREGEPPPVAAALLDALEAVTASSG